MKENKKEILSCIEDCFSYDNPRYWLFDKKLIDSAKERSLTRDSSDDKLPLILGIVLNRGNIAMVFRRGFKVECVKCFSSSKWDELQGWVCDEISSLSKRPLPNCHLQKMHPKFEPDRIYVGISGLEKPFFEGLRDNLSKCKCEKSQTIESINLGGSAKDSNYYYNKRAELYSLAAAWFYHWVYLPNNQDLIDDLSYIRIKPNEKQIVIVSKEEILYHFGRSTDIADAFALTFAGGIENHKPITIKIADVESPF